VTFVGVMALGGFLGVMGVPLPFVEIGIAMSVIVLGAIVALGVKAPLAVAMAAVGFFAIFHGHVHGTEMPLAVAGATYGLGFMLATALLHALGIGVGFLIGMTSKAFGNTVYRIAGGLATAAGVTLLLGFN
jgi:urease accessory protein